MEKVNNELQCLKNELNLIKEKMAIMKLVLDESTDPIFNILADGTYRYVNNAFADAFKLTVDEIIGKKIWDIYSPEEADKRMDAVNKAILTGEKVDYDFKVPRKSSDLFFITTMKPVSDNSGCIKSVICISKNITERKLVELQKEKLIADLSDALARINVLSGMLPICANCKKIRNDQGYWTQIESYISEHSDAEFSHSICPDCAKKIYPGFNCRCETKN